MNRWSRRQVLRGSGLALGALLAGCVDDGATTSEPSPNSGSTPATGESPTPERSTPTPDEPTTEPETPTPTPHQDGVAWRFDVNATIDVSPAVADGTVYVGGWRETSGTPTPGDSQTPDPSSTLRALSLDDGAEQWRTDLGAPVQRRPRVVGDTVYVVRGFNGLHGNSYQVRAVSTDGEQQWTHETRRLKFLTVLGADESGFYVGTHDDALQGEGEQVTALGTDGSVRWQAESGDVSNGTLDGGTVYVSDYAGKIRAFEADDGTVRWTVQQEEYNLPVPVLAGDVVATVGDGVVGFDRADGTLQWAYRDREPAGLVAGNDQLFVPTTDGSAVALNPSNGIEDWAVATGSDPPVLAPEGDRLYVADGSGRLWALETATGDQLWETDLGGRAGLNPAGDRIYALSSDRVVAVDASDGARRGSAGVSGDPVGLVPVDDMAVLATSDGVVSGLSL